jgi:hypothetical protein
MGLHLTPANGSTSDYNPCNSTDLISLQPVQQGTAEKILSDHFSDPERHLLCRSLCSAIGPELRKRLE